MGRFLRPAIFGVVVLILLMVPVAGILARSYFLAPTQQPAKTQPIKFPHPVHVGLGLDCTYCHRTATTSMNAGVPALQQCIGCHQVIGTPEGRPELKKVVDAFTNGTPVQWNRVHQMPNHVHFNHSMHLNAGFQCADCHGNVGGMQQVKQVRDLRMGDCITCHKQNNARTDCSVCHY